MNIRFWIFLIVLFYLKIQLAGQAPCGVDQMSVRAEQIDPDGFGRQMVLQKLTQSGHIADILPREGLIIPVVVHIVYFDETENISDAQVLSQIEALNADFSGLRIIDDLPVEFKSIAGASEISFCLANQDIDGNPSNGIIRKKTSVKNIGLQQDASSRLKLHYDHLGGSTPWPVDQYLNIWVCRMDQYLGYATRPGEAVYENEDGVVIDYRSFGRGVDYGQPLKHGLGRTAVHEVGHYLGLFHLWGPQNSECGDDQIDDTPPQKKAHFGCPTHPQISCGNPNLFMNFMDYADDPCMYMFTMGQCNRMKETILTYRPGLLSNDRKNCKGYHTPTTSLKDRIKLNSTFVTDQLTISQDESFKEMISIEIYDLSGRLLKSEVKLSQREIHICYNSDFPPGYYILSLRTNNDRLVFKFLNI